MPLVQAKCTNCGSNLEVDKTKDAAICPFCGTPYIVEKAINYFITINGASVETTIGKNNSDFIITNQLFKEYNIKGDCLVSYNGTDTDVVVPDSIVVIGKEAFKDCKYIKTIKLPEGLREIGNSAFEGCMSLTSITIPNGVQSIGKYAFAECRNLTELVLPNSITDIDRDSFMYDSKLHLIYPQSLSRKYA